MEKIQSSAHLRFLSLCLGCEPFEDVNHPRKLTYLYQKLNFIAISKWFHLTEKGDIMRKIYGRLRPWNP